MRSRIDRVHVEVTRPEAVKFRHPLLLLHGLWTGDWIWERVAPYLAQRGWESWAPSLLEGAVPESFATAVADIERVVCHLPGPPIVVAHDTGVLLAAAHAVRGDVAALVAIAPIVAAGRTALGSDLLAWPRFWPVRAWGRHVSPPRGRAAAVFLGAAGDRCRDRFAPDSGPMFRALARRRIGLPETLGCPGLVLSGDRDRVSLPRVGAEIARRYGWERRVYPESGHFPMLERGWGLLAADVHRWVVRQLGADLLALLDQEEEP